MVWNPHVFNILAWEMCFPPQQRALFRHLLLQKWSETFMFLYNILSWTCSSRHSGVPFFDIPTSKIWSENSFVHFDFTICFAVPQRRAIFRHPNFQKWSETQFLDIRTSKSCPRMACFVHFDFKMCFAPRQRRALFHLIWPHGYAPAALASLLLDPPDPQIIGKHRVLRLS